MLIKCIIQYEIKIVLLRKFGRVGRAISNQPMCIEQPSIMTAAQMHDST